MLINFILRLLRKINWTTMSMKTTIFWFWIFICVFIIFLNSFIKKMMKKKRIIHEIQKCRFLKQFFDQKCRFLKRNNDDLNEILNFQNDDDDENEIFFFFTLSNKSEISKLIINDLNFFDDFLTKKKTLSQYVLILSISTILIRQFLWRTSCKFSQTAHLKWIFKIE